MSARSSSIHFLEPLHVASYAIACQVLPPGGLFATINTVALAEIGCWGIDLAYKSCKLVAELKPIFQDLSQLGDGIDEYQKFLQLESFLAAAHQEQIAVSGSDNPTVLPKEVWEEIFSYLAIEQLAPFSKVSKYCYSAVKADAVWEYQLKKLFPQVAYLSRAECGFSIEQQVKMAYKRTRWLLEKYDERYNQNDVLVKRLYNEKLTTDWYTLYNLVGNDYNGGESSINTFSQQGKLSDFIQKLRVDFDEFQKTERFNDFVLKARQALDIQKRSKDLPERVKKMEKRIDENILIQFLLAFFMSGSNDSGESCLYAILCAKEKLMGGDGFSLPELERGLQRIPKPDAQYLYAIESFEDPSTA